MEELRIKSAKKSLPKIKENHPTRIGSSTSNQNPVLSGPNKMIKEQTADQSLHAGTSLE